MTKANKFLMVILVTIMFTGLFWKSIKPIILDVFPSKHRGYEPIRYITATDPEGDSIYWYLIKVMPPHDFKLVVDTPDHPNSATLYMNRENINSDWYKVWWMAGTKNDSGGVSGQIQWYEITDVTFIK